KLEQENKEIITKLYECNKSMVKALNKLDADPDGFLHAYYLSHVLQTRNGTLILNQEKMTDLDEIELEKRTRLPLNSPITNELDKKTASNLYKWNLEQIKAQIMEHNFNLHYGFGKSIPGKTNGKVSDSAKVVFDKIVSVLDSDKMIEGSTYEKLTKEIQKQL